MLPSSLYCDYGRPECSRCKRFNLQCTGYERDLIFVAHISDFVAHISEINSSPTPDKTKSRTASPSGVRKPSRRRVSAQGEAALDIAPFPVRPPLPPQILPQSISMEDCSSPRPRNSFKMARRPLEPTRNFHASFRSAVIGGGTGRVYVFLSVKFFLPA